MFFPRAPLTLSLSVYSIFPLAQTLQFCHFLHCTSAFRCSPQSLDVSSIINRSNIPAAMRRPAAVLALPDLNPQGGRHQSPVPFPSARSRVSVARAKPCSARPHCVQPDKQPGSGSGGFPRPASDRICRPLLAGERFRAAVAELIRMGGR